MDPTRLETTYADLRDDDLLEDKSGSRWHVTGVGHDGVAIDKNRPGSVSFWLGDARTKVKAHHLTKPAGDPCVVFRIPTAVDDLAALEAGSALPDPSSAPLAQGGGADLTTSAARGAATGGRLMTPDGGGEPDPWRTEQLEGEAAARHDAAVAAVEQQLGGKVEAEVTDAEVDAARRATDDEPVVLPLFESMTDLEQRSHLYLLHGVWADDLEDRKTRADIHVKAHSDRAQGKLKSRHTPHVHSEAASEQATVKA